jgi:DNA-directed RNA polymerase subunit N (RpoN/RPB10)
LRCLHCGAAISATDLADNWCNACGKRLPSSFQDAVKSTPGHASSPGRVPEVENMGRQRLLCGGVIIALVGLLVLAFIPNLL